MSAATATFVGLLVILLNNEALCSDDEVKLVNMLFDHRGYNRLIRPVTELNMTVQVDFGLAMVQLINVDEKSQTMKTNVWLRMTWYDYQLRWDPADFGGIQVIRVSPSKVWKPDIVLFNNADGKYEVSWQPNVLVFSNGVVLWIPPAIYQSSCTIYVKYFPFDQQECEMKFGSWTFDANQVILGWYENSKVADLTDYWKSGSWDIIDCPGNITRIERPGHAPQVMMIFKLTIRRKTLFYTVNLIIPCVLISFLSVCVFYLPADAGEKMTLCISILLALVVFLLLVSKILPPTAIAVPLISKYLLFTFVMNIITIVFTVIIINLNFRTPRTHTMPGWVRSVFLWRLPRLLRMKRPSHIEREQQRLSRLRQIDVEPDRDDAGIVDDCNGGRASSQQALRLHRTGTGTASFDSLDGDARRPNERRNEEATSFGGMKVTPELRRAIGAINFISTHMQMEDDFSQVLQDWKYVASVIDRIQLLIFTSVTVIGTVAILIDAPFIMDFVDQEQIITKLTGVSEKS